MEAVGKKVEAAVTNAVDYKVYHPFSGHSAARKETREDEFRREEADTLARLRTAVREEGKEAEIVRILAKRLVALRNARKRWARQSALQMPSVMYQ